MVGIGSESLFWSPLDTSHLEIERHSNLKVCFDCLLYSKFSLIN